MMIISVELEKKTWLVGAFNAFEAYLSKWGSSPRIRVKIYLKEFETATVDHLCPHFCPSNASSQAFAPVFMEHGLNQKNE